MNKGLIALALGTFALGISEFLMMGILSSLAADLDVSVSDAGHLITAYATGVCFGAPALLLVRKYSLKKIMLILAAIIAVGNCCAAISPGFWSLFVSRFISGLPHGAYFGVGAIVARRLAAEGKETQAVSIMIAGMTVATLLGVPMGTFLCENVSWRVAFAIVSVAGVATFCAIHSWVPRLEALPDRGFRSQFHFLRTLPPWLIFGGVLFGQIGIYCWYSYVDPLLLHVSGFAPSALTWLMVVAGFGMFAGNLIAGRLADHYKPSIVAAWVQLSGVAVLLLIFFFASVQWAAVVLTMLGTAALFGSGSPLQSSIVGYAKGGEMLGAACIQIAYNAGNAIAASIGSAVIAHGFGYQYPALVGIPLVVIGSALLFVLYFRNERAVKPN